MSEYSYADTYCITTSAPQHNASTHSVDYYPDGDGDEWYGYITSFDQYKNSVNKNLTKESLQFQFICPSTKASKVIKSDGDLRGAVKDLDDRGVLLVTALKTSGKGKNAGGRKSKKGNRKETDDSEDYDWDIERDSSSESSDNEETKSKSNNKKGKGNRKGKGKGGDAKSIVDFDVEKKEAKVRSILSHFDLHGEIECYYGGSMAKCNGIMYQCTYNSDYHLSPECYKTLSDDEKEVWESAVHWGGPVPSHSLSYEDNGDGVRMLQYLLTRLGFMNLENTSQQTGWYLSCTQDGVSAFRKKFKVEGGDSTVYDKKTANKLAEVVAELRKKGHKYL